MIPILRFQEFQSVESCKSLLNFIKNSLHDTNLLWKGEFLQMSELGNQELLAAGRDKQFLENNTHDITIKQAEVSYFTSVWEKWDIVG